jgi:hypothetical protein
LGVVASKLLSAFGDAAMVRLAFEYVSNFAKATSHSFFPETHPTMVGIGIVGIGFMGINKSCIRFFAWQSL